MGEAFTKEFLIQTIRRVLLMGESISACETCVPKPFSCLFVREFQAKNKKTSSADIEFVPAVCMMLAKSATIDNSAARAYIAVHVYAHIYIYTHT